MSAKYSIYLPDSSFISRSCYYAYCKRIQFACLKNIKDEIDFAYIKERLTIVNLIKLHNKLKYVPFENTNNI